MFQIQSSFIQIFGIDYGCYFLAALIAPPISAVVAALCARALKIESSRVFGVCCCSLFLVSLGQIFQQSMPALAKPFAVFLSMPIIILGYALIGKLLNQKTFYLRISPIVSIFYLGTTKLGCFLAGCCHGRPCSEFFSVTYGSNSMCLQKGVAFFPTQLCALFIMWAAAIAMIFIYRASDMRRKAAGRSLAGWQLSAALAAFGSFAYYACMAMVDPSANLMIIHGIDFAPIMATISALLSIIFALRARKSEC